MTDTNELIRQRLAALEQEEAAVLFACLASTGDGSDQPQSRAEPAQQAGPLAGMT